MDNCLCAEYFDLLMGKGLVYQCQSGFGCQPSFPVFGDDRVSNFDTPVGVRWSLEAPIAHDLAVLFVDIDIVRPLEGRGLVQPVFEYFQDDGVHRPAMWNVCVQQPCKPISTLEESADKLRCNGNQSQSSGNDFCWRQHKYYDLPRMRSERAASNSSTRSAPSSESPARPQLGVSNPCSLS